jgi:hypothetical protein
VQEGLDHILGGTLGLRARRTLYREIFPHDETDSPRKNPSWRLNGDVQPTLVLRLLAPASRPRKSPYIQPNRAKSAVLRL